MSKDAHIKTLERSRFDTSQGQFCQHCQAWRGSLGLEPTPELYVEHLVSVFREVWRVLRVDGTVWLNLGDSYATSPPGNKGFHYGKGRRAQGTLETGHKHRKRDYGNLKPKDLVGIPWRVAFALQADGWWLRSDIIWHKCLSGGTRLYARTQKGDGAAMLKDLARLAPESVKLWNGEKWTQVTRWTQTARPDDPVEIVLRSGERIGCTPDHRWPTGRGIVRTDALKIGDVIETARLPEPQESKTPAMLPDISIGWFVGMYLAEGSRDTYGRIQISSHIKEQSRFDRLQKIATMYGGTCRKYQTSENGMMITVSSKILSAVIDTYINGNTAKYKHLSSKCWKRNDEFINSVLLGYLEGDGHYDTSNDRWRIGFTRNYELEASLRTICARLGYQLRVKPTMAKSQNGDHPSFRGEIRFQKSNHHNARDDGEIVDIRRSRARQFWDVTVEDAPHLFALASGVLTHNSNCMPESVTDRPTKAHEYVFLLTKAARYYYDREAVKEKTITKERLREKQNGESAVDTKKRGHSGCCGVATTTRNRRSVWTIPTQSYKGAHFATFPEKLVEPCILAGTSARGECPECGVGWVRVVEKKFIPQDDVSAERGIRGASGNKLQPNDGWDGFPRGSNHTTTTGWRPQCQCRNADGNPHDPIPQTVLDPFSGTATVGRVATQHRRRFVGLELNPDYLTLAEKRTRNLAVKLPL